MSGPDDARLERELRERLGRLDPGPAPFGLRDRVDRLPDVASLEPPIRRRVARAILPALGVAAAIGLLVLAGSLLAPGRGSPGPGASAVPASPAPSAGAIDLGVVGPGIVGTPDTTGPWIVAILLGAAIAIAAWRLRRRWRYAAAVLLLAPLPIVVGYVLSSVPPPRCCWFYSTAEVGVREASIPGSAQKPVLYVTANPGEPFRVGFGISSEDRLPVRLLGVVQDGVAEFDPTITWAAVWLDAGRGGGVSDAAAPLESVELTGPDSSVALWLVGRAGECALGDAFDPAVPFATMGDFRTVRVSYTVFGWPHVAEMELPFELVQPSTSTCSGEPPPSRSVAP